MRQIQQ